jgi:predicted nucleic acid-binding protein
MSRCYFDTIFLYLHLRAPTGKAPRALENWRRRSIAELAFDSAVISALVLDELAYRLILAWLRDDGDEDPLSTYRADATRVMRANRHRLRKTWAAVDSLAFELQPTDTRVVDRAKSLMSRPGLTPRDAFHAAHALEGDCSLIVSSDDTFDRVPGLRRLAP